MFKGEVVGNDSGSVWNTEFMVAFPVAGSFQYKQRSSSDWKTGLQGMFPRQHGFRVQLNITFLRGFCLTNKMYI